VARRLKATKTEHGDGRVQSRVIPSRRLMVVDSDHPLWQTRRAGGKPVEAEVWDGAIVWVRAPHDADDGDDRRLRDELVEAGALKVKLLPREKPPDVLRDGEGTVVPSPEEAVAGTDEARGSMRETAEAMAREIASGDELAALLEALDEALAEARL